MTAPRSGQELHAQLLAHIDVLWPEVDSDALIADMLAAMGLPESRITPDVAQPRWDERDCLLITYGDSIVAEGEHSLRTLRQFFLKHLADCISSVHLLPFYPFSSDDGFSVINYAAVNESLGDWDDIDALAADTRLMFDVVINHCSSRSVWFENFKSRSDPGKDYFVEASPDLDLADVVRPRTTPLLREVETADGPRHVWCTFSHDQIDLDFRNPQVLLEMLRIMALYMDHGAKLFRLDAIAFVWKILGSSCINLDETHEFVRLLRTLVSYRDPELLLITETNIPNRENLAYFGNGNEAHVVYNFALPPLLLHTLWSGDCAALKLWLMSMPPARDDTCYLNFVASHDGIGLRPVEGMLDDAQLQSMLDTVERQGGRVSWRAMPDGGRSPYELNIALFDALQGTHEGLDHCGEARFICAHSIQLALEGLPAIYIHSLLGTRNDTLRMENSGHNRCINRHQWPVQELEAALAEDTSHARMLAALKKRIALRAAQPAFHPNATQFTLHLGDALFGFWRQSRNRQQDIFVINNVSNSDQVLFLHSLNLTMNASWSDLISGDALADLKGEMVLAPYQCVWLTNAPGGIPLV